MGFGGLYISISGIYTNKKALDTVSHNIANVNNPNYVRQRAIHADRRYSRTQNLKFQMGTGVNIQEIRQIRDEFLDIRLRREMATFGYYHTKYEIISDLEDIFREIKIPGEIENGGLQDIMNEFWNGWSELSKEPDNLAIRGLLHENAVAFTTAANHMSIQLDNLQFNLNKEILNKTEEINKLLEDIANLNKQIKLAEAYGSNISANDLRDERNAALDKLSQLIPITHYENKYGEEVVSLYGRNLINEDYFNPIEVRLDDKGHGQIHWSDTGAKIQLKGLGELGGYIDARDKVVVEYKNRLNIMVGEFAKIVNAYHIHGVGLDGTTGENFFEISNSEDPAASIRVNPDLADFNKIAASKTGAKGDGDIAKAILDLREKSLYHNYDKYYDTAPYRYEEIDTSEIDLSNPSGIFEFMDNYIKDNNFIDDVDGFYRNIIKNLGLEGEEAKNMAMNQLILMTQIDQRRQEISSVSLDEEMADMLKYQHSYIANSRVINAIDEMIDQVVNRLGLVGR